MVADGKRLRAVCLDFSLSGCQFECAEELPLQSTITVETDATDFGVWWKGTLAWRRRNPDDALSRCGMQWEEMGAPNRAALGDFLRPFLGWSGASRGVAKATDSAGGVAVRSTILLATTAQYRRTVRRRWMYVGVAGVSSGLGVVLLITGLLSSIEARLLDARQRLIPATPLANEIVVLLVDDATIAQFGWPLPRTVHATALSLLSKANARAVLYDVAFADVTVGAPEQDRLFSQSAQAAQCPIFAAVFGPDDAKVPDNVPSGQSPMRVVPRAVLVDRPIPALADVAAGIAHLHMTPGADGVFRSLPPLLMTRDGLVPSLGLAGVLCSQGRVDKVAVTAEINGRRLRVTERGGRRTDMPIDDHGEVTLFYRATLATSGAVSVVDFLKSYKGAVAAGHEQEWLAQYAGKLVVVGQSAHSFGDWGATPREPQAPLVLVHATFMDNLLRGGFVHRAPFLPQLAILLALVGLTMLAAARPKVWVGSFLGLAVLAAYWAVNAWALASFQLWLEMAATTGTGLLALVGIQVGKSFQTEARERLLRQAFERFVSPTILQRVLDDPNQMDVGGHRQRISILFSDVQGYTSLSNTVSPRDVLAVLGEYLDAMVRITLAHEGTVDKIMGDGIMCFFGDPIPRADHAEMAVRTALAMQERMQELQRDWDRRGLATLRIRVGIATGDAFVGNIGAAGHVEYTAIGQAVNLASRLENHAPPDGVLVCRDTARELGDRYHLRESEPMRLKGFAEEYRPFLVRGAPPRRHLDGGRP